MIPLTARGSRHGRGRELFASCACGNGRPHHLFFRKRWCRLAVPEKNRRGSRCLLPLLKQKSTPDTPTRLAGSAFTQPKSPVQKEGVYGGTWFPRQIARGPRCGAALHFRRNAAIVGGCEALPLGEETSAPSGRKEKPRPLCGKKVLRPRRKQKKRP